MNRRQLLAKAGLIGAGAIVAGSVGVGSRLFARDRGSDPEKSGAEMLSPKTAEAVKKGLGYLAGRQREDGAFGTGGYGKNVAVCGLAGMAFIASGSTPGRGPHAKEVDHLLDYILAQEGESGFIDVPAAASHGPMYGHGFATLFLAECYGMTLRSDIREKLTKAVQLIVNTQNPEGGWRYQPVRNDADISVTVCQVMALRAARNAGLYVPHETMAKSVEYVKKCQNADGGFMYMSTGGPSAFPRSAAGVVALYSAGVYEGPEIDKGLEYLMAQIPRGDDFSHESHYYYGHYYAVQAMWHAGGDYWTRWYPAVRDAILKRQIEDGSWPDSAYGSEYATSMACIILQMPNNYLPIFQR
jgi:hypothetical protein